MKLSMQTGQVLLFNLDMGGLSSISYRYNFANVNKIVYVMDDFVWNCIDFNFYCMAVDIW